MPLAFSQEEIERELSDALPHGRRVAVARRSGLGESYLKRQLNPDDETPSCVFKTLQIVCALDEIDPGDGEAFWQTIVKLRELSKPLCVHSALSLNQETGKLAKEIADFVNAKFVDLPPDDLMRELLEARRQLDIVHEQLISDYNRANKVVQFGR